MRVAGRAGMFLEHVAAVDQGTSSTRVVVFDRSLRPVRTAVRKVAVHAPAPGWLQMEAGDVVQSVRECLDEACAGLHVSLVGLANQRETALALDSVSGEPLGPALLWSDARTAEIVRTWHRLEEQEKSNCDSSIRTMREITGLPFSPYFSAGKLAWLLRHEPRVARAAAENRLAFATVDALLLRALTGKLRTDASNASRTMLMDLDTLAWSSAAVKFCGLGAYQMPEILPSIADFGTVLEGAAKGARVTGVLGDQQAALLGQGCTRAGESKCTFGTGAFLLQHAGDAVPKNTEGLIATVAVQTDVNKATYAVEGSVGAAGSVVSWLRDKLGILNDFAEVDEVARQGQLEGGLVEVVPAFGGLLAPHWRPDARACILNMTLDTSRAQLVFACLKGVAHCVADVQDAMTKHHKEDAISDGGVLLVDGGLAASRVLLQLVADLTGKRVAIAHDPEATARGAAVAAGVGGGWWTLDRAREQEQPSVIAAPSISISERALERARWKKAVEKALP